MASKTCSKCREVKPMSKEFYYKGKNKTGFMSHCKSCHNAYTRTWKHRPESADYREGERERNTLRRSHPGARETAKVTTAQWRVQNPDRVKENNRAFYLKNREQQVRRVVLAQRANPEKARQRSKIFREKAGDAERDRCRLKSSARRAQMRFTATVPLTLKDLDAMLDGQDRRCYLCGCELKGRDFHLEHKIPLIRGGSHTPSNLAAACADCNLSKGKKTAEEFLQWRAKLK